MRDICGMRSITVDDHFDGAPLLNTNCGHVYSSLWHEWKHSHEGLCYKSMWSPNWPNSVFCGGIILVVFPQLFSGSTPTNTFAFVRYSTTTCSKNFDSRIRIQKRKSKYLNLYCDMNLVGRSLKSLKIKKMYVVLTCQCLVSFEEAESRCVVGKWLDMITVCCYEKGKQG